MIYEEWKTFLVRSTLAPDASKQNLDSSKLMRWWDLIENRVTKSRNLKGTVSKLITE